MVSSDLEGLINPYEAPELLHEECNEFYENVSCVLKHVFIPGYSFYYEHQENRRLFNEGKSDLNGIDGRGVFACLFFELARTSVLCYPFLYLYLEK